MPAGRGVGGALRLPAPPAAAPDNLAGSAVCGGGILRLGISGIRDLPRGYPNGLYGGTFLGRVGVGSDFRKMAAPCIFVVLVRVGGNMEAFDPTGDKNFQKKRGIYKNFICILEKMG